MNSSVEELPSGAPIHVRLRKALGRVRRRFQLDRFDVFARLVPATEPFEPPAGYEYAWAASGDVATCDEYHTELDARERAEGEARLALGHRAVLGRDEQGEVVFTMWVNPHCLNIPGEVKRRLAPDQWFIYKAFTSPDHRGRKLYQAGMRFVLCEMAREGLRELVGYAHVKKRVSRKGLAALDFEERGRYWALSMPGLQRTLLSSRLRKSFPDAVPRTNAVARVLAAPPAP